MFWYAAVCRMLYSSEEIGCSKSSFNFLHLGIQEYFATKHVATLPGNELYMQTSEVNIYR